MAEDLVAFAKATLQPVLEIASLGDLYSFYKKVPVQYALIGHCLFVATMAPDFKKSFLVHFWVGRRIENVRSGYMAFNWVIQYAACNRVRRGHVHRSLAHSLACNGLSRVCLQLTFLAGFGGGVFSSLLMMVRKAGEEELKGPSTTCVRVTPHHLHMSGVAVHETHVVFLS